MVRDSISGMHVFRSRVRLKQPRLTAYSCARLSCWPKHPRTADGRNDRYQIGCVPDPRQGHGPEYLAIEIFDDENGWLIRFGNAVLFRADVYAKCTPPDFPFVKLHVVRMTVNTFLRSFRRSFAGRALMTAGQLCIDIFADLS